VTIRGKI